MKNPLKHPRLQTLFLAHVCALTVVMIFGIAIGLVVPYMPMLEGFVRPIVTAALADPAPFRSDGKACLSLHLHKTRRGVPIVYQFSVEVRQNENWLEPVNVNAHLADVRNMPAPDDFVEHPVGDSWKRRWCFDMPNSIAPWQVIRVSGFSVHRVHPLWETHTPLPSFVIAGVK